MSPIVCRRSLAYGTVDQHSASARRQQSLAKSTFQHEMRPKQCKFQADHGAVFPWGLHRSGAGLPGTAKNGTIRLKYGDFIAPQRWTFRKQPFILLTHAVLEHTLDQPQIGVLGWCLITV